MDDFNRKMDEMSEEIASMKEDLLDKDTKIAELDKELLHRNAKAVKLEDELNDFKIKVVNLEEEIEKNNSKIVEFETELTKSKGKVLELEQKLNEYESKTESGGETETDSASLMLPKKRIREDSGHLKILEGKTSNGIDLHESELPHFEDSLEVAFFKCQNLVKRRRMCLSEENLLKLAVLEVASGVKNRPVLYLAQHFVPNFQRRCTEKIVKTKWVENCSTTRAQALYVEFFINHLPNDSLFFYVTQKYDKASVCILEINKECIMQHNFQTIKSETRISSLCDTRFLEREDDLITISWEAWNYLKSKHYNITSVFQSELEEYKQILDVVQHFKVKSDNQNPQSALKSNTLEVQDKLEADFKKFQERVRQRHVGLEQNDMLQLAAYELKLGIKNGAAWTIGQRNFDDFEKLVNDTRRRELLTMRALVEKCRGNDSDSDSRFFFTKSGYEYAEPDDFNMTTIEIKQDGTFHSDGYQCHVSNVEFGNNFNFKVMFPGSTWMPRSHTKIFISKETPEIRDAIVTVTLALRKR